MEEAQTLDRLGGGIGGVAGEEQPVPGLDLVGESHEDAGVQGQSQCHFAGDELGTLLCVGESSHRNTPVGHRAPEVGTHKVIPPLLGGRCGHGSPDRHDASF